MDKLDNAIKSNDFNTIAGLMFGVKEVKMPRQISVVYTPTKYQITIRRK